MMEAPLDTASSVAAALDVSLIVGDADDAAEGPRIYLGSQAATQDPTTLAQQYGITRLLSLGAPPLMTPLPPAFESLHLDIADVPEVDLLALLPAILAFLRGDGRGLGGDKAPATLVHCLVGQSRSAAAVLAHLILPTTQTTPSLVAAHARLAARRPALCVNPGFLRQVAWLEDYVRSEATAAEYRVALLWEHGPVLSAAATAAARQGVVGRVDATVAKVTAAVAPFVPSGVGKCGVWRCRQCWFALFTVNDTVRHGHAVGRTAVARMALMAEAAPPAAAAFWGYAREFGARPLMHVRGAGKAKAGRGQKGSKGGKGVGDDGNAEKEIDADAECPWVYTQPPKWALPALLLDQGGSGAGAAVVSLHCPGRHCGRAVGVAAPLANVNALTACECGSPTPWVVARFQRRVVVLEAEVEEGVGGTGAGGV